VLPPNDNSALYDAVSNGPSSREHRVSEIDFRRPSKFVREQVRRVEHTHRAFCRSASSRMATELRTDVGLRLDRTDQLPYSTVMIDEVPPAALVAILELRPLGTQAVLVIELPLAFRLVERLLGGGDVVGEDMREGLTDVELAVAQRALQSLIEPLSATWQDLAGVELALVATSATPTTVQIVPPSEPTLVVVIEAELDHVVSPIRLCVPHRSIVAVTDRLDHGEYGHYVPEEAPDGAVRRAVDGVELELRAEAGAVDMTLDEVLRLRPGDVVRLNRPADQGIVLWVGDQQTHVATPGRNRTRRAVRVDGRWEA
jgi:flagellar motor switch protein FliM